MTFILPSLQHPMLRRSRATGKHRVLNSPQLFKLGFKRIMTKFILPSLQHPMLRRSRATGKHRVLNSPQLFKLGFKRIMTKFILGKKVEMSQKFIDDKVVPVTKIQAGPCVVTQIRNEKKDGYSAVQIGFEKLDKKKIHPVKSSEAGAKQFNRVKKPKKDKPFRYLKEFRTPGTDLKVGDEIGVDVFKTGDKVKVSGITKGKGFQGVVKRWGFHGADASHGTKHHERAPGSSGATGPARVFKGKKMPGRMGGKRMSVSNLKVIDILPKENILLVKGAVPGARNGLLEIVGA